jgi:hypothetical protein
MKSRNGSYENRDVERELAAVDAALAGKAVEHELAELAELAVALQAERSRPSAGFAAELDARLRAGFPPLEQATAPDDPKVEITAIRRRRFGWLWPTRRPALPLAIATAASVFIVVTAVVSSGVLSPDETREEITAPQPGRPSEEPSPKRASPEAGGTSRDGAQALSESPRTSRLGTAQRSRGAVPPPARNRQVERDAALTLAAPGNEIEGVADEVIRVTDRYRGFVLRSSVAGGESRRAGATLDLRIPSDRLSDAISELSRLAHVRSRTQSTRDITGNVVSARARLNEALAERQALLRQLGRATTPNETASIRTRLRLTNREIARVRARLAGLRHRVQLSAVAVTIEADEALVSSDGDWTPGEALDDALGILSALLAAALVTLAVLVPLLLLGFITWVALRRTLRVRRERALDRAL